MAKIRHIFLDFDGVINDDERMNREACRFIAERMRLQHGGTVEKWAGALQRASGAASQWARRSPLRESEVVQWLREYDGVWLEELFSAGGLEVPSKGRAELGWRLREEAYKNIDSIYPEVPKALALLAGHGGEGQHTTASIGRSLYVASGGRSARLEVTLKRAGLRELFVGLFGCDTVNVVKESPEYYRRVFERLRLVVGECLVVDDNPNCIGWAREAGAATAFLDRKGRGVDEAADLAASNLTELAHKLEEAADATRSETG